MSEGSDDYGFPYGMPALVSNIHPKHGEQVLESRHEEASFCDRLTLVDLLMLMQPGDDVLWSGRKQPLRVEDRNHAKERRYDNGWREIAWNVKGNRGGEYLLSNWWHWGDDGEGFDDCTGLYPQTHRTTDGAWQDATHFEGLALDGPVAEVHPEGDLVDDWQPEDMHTVIHSPPMDDRHYAGRVVDVQWGQCIVEPLNLQPLIDARYAVPESQIIGYRWSP
jgi:hypothetical protein